MNNLRFFLTVFRLARWFVFLFAGIGLIFYHKDVLSSDMEASATGDNAADPTNSEMLYQAIRNSYIFPSVYTAPSYTAVYSTAGNKVVGWTKPSLGISPYHIRPAVHVLHAPGTKHEEFNTTLIQTDAGMTAFKDANGSTTEHSALLKIDCDATNFLDDNSAALLEGWFNDTKFPDPLEGSDGPTQEQRDACKNNQQVADTFFIFTLVGLGCIGLGLLCIIAVHLGLYSANLPFDSWYDSDVLTSNRKIKLTRSLSYIFNYIGYFFFVLTIFDAFYYDAHNNSEYFSELTMSKISSNKLVTMTPVDHAYFGDTDHYSSPSWPQNYGVTSWLIFAGLISIFVDLLILSLRVARGGGDKFMGGDMMTSIMESIL